MDTSTMYTAEAPGKMSPIYLNSMMTILGAVWPFPMPTLGWRFSLGVFPESSEGFIGILSDDEAREMKKEIGLFKKRFDDDLAKRNKILFGE